VRKAKRAHRQSAQRVAGRVGTALCAFAHPTAAEGLAAQFAWTKSDQPKSTNGVMPALVAGIHALLAF
jgi:hypothetical protein